MSVLSLRLLAALIASAIALACAWMAVAWSRAPEPGYPPPVATEASKPPTAKEPATARAASEERAVSEAAGEESRKHPAAPAPDPPRASSPAVWVRAGERVGIRAAPGGEVVATASRRTEFGSPTVFRVLRRAGRWAGISTPALPNGQLGWVRLDPDTLRTGSTRTSILIDLSERRAELYEAGRLVESFTVTIGAADSSTPTGRFAVTDTFRGGLHPVYGCCAVALSANQPNLPSGWQGGSRIAIHGTTGPLGVATSNGCVRTRDRHVSKLVERIELGAPVRIRA